MTVPLNKLELGLLDPHQLLMALTEPLTQAMADPAPVPVLLIKRQQEIVFVVVLPNRRMAPPVTVALLPLKVQPVTLRVSLASIAPP